MNPSSYQESTLLGSDSSSPSSPSSSLSPTRQQAASSGLSAITAPASEDGLITPQTTSATPRTLTFEPTLEAIRENRQGDTVEGWPLLAKLMANKADFEAFPRFEELNVKNLLYYQVELASIKIRLERREKSDRNVSSEISDAADFHKYAHKLIDSESDQWDEVVKLRTALDGYNRSLLQYAQVSALAEPSTGNMKTLVQWLHAPNAGNFKVAGRGSQVWGMPKNKISTKPSLATKILDLLLGIFRRPTVPPTRSDLVAPRGQKSVDGFTRWIAEKFLPFWCSLIDDISKEKNASGGGANTESGAHDVENVVPAALQMGEKNLGEDLGYNGELKDLKLEFIRSYSGSSLLHFTTTVTTLFACMLPMVAIFVLSRVPELSTRLGLIASFTAVFCLGLMMAAQVTKVQVFTATSAFLAVLVVFVQNG
jgi:hypothetical protein